jgi:hypothetical protein
LEYLTDDIPGFLQSLQSWQEADGPISHISYFSHLRKVLNSLSGFTMQQTEVFQDPPSKSVIISETPKFYN